MTVVKTVGVRGEAHIASLRAYLEDDRALALWCSNIADESRPFEEMARTRKAYGHDVASRKGCVNEEMWHQVLGFLPEDADFNGGKMSAIDCMRFADEWLERNYPYQEAMLALHREHCSADGTNRYAVHIAMNRTMLDGTGRRLDEGRAAVAKAKRAQAMREMDSRWGLQQVKANERNSAIHARQPTKAERKMAERGIESEKAFIKKRVKERVSEIRAEGFEGNRMRELSRRLVPDGVKMTVSKSGKQVQFKTGRLTVNGNKLGRGFSMGGLAHGLGMRAGMAIAKGVERDMDN